MSRLWPTQACWRFPVSRDWIQEDGPSALVARKRGRPSNRQLPPGLESRTRGLIRDSYADFGPTLVAEKLRERHDIDISKACVRRIMIDAGFWVPRKLRQLRHPARQTAPVPFTNPGHSLILDETQTSWGNLPAG